MWIWRLIPNTNNINSPRCLKTDTRGCVRQSVCECACMCDKHVVPVVVACVCVCVPHRLRCTVGNEGIRSREQINLPEDNEIISHLQLLDEERKCVCVFVQKRERELMPVTNPCQGCYVEKHRRGSGVAAAAANQPAALHTSAVLRFRPGQQTLFAPAFYILFFLYSFLF